VRAVSVADASKSIVAPVVVTLGVDEIAITPIGQTLLVGDTIRFTGTVEGMNPNRALRWSAVQGSIDSLGLYRTPSAPVVDTIRAVSVVDSSKQSRAAVNVVGHVLSWVRFRDWGATRRDNAYAVAIDASGNAVVGGIKWLSNSGNPVPPAFGAFASFDSAGNERWAIELASPSFLFRPMAASGSRSEFYFTGWDRSGLPTQTLCGAVTSSGSISLDPFQNAVPGIGGAGVTLFGQVLYVITGNKAIRMTPSCAVIDTVTLRSDVAGTPSLWVASDHLLVGGNNYDTAGEWNVAGFVRRLDLDGALIWDRVYDDCGSGRVVEDVLGVIYFACNALSVGGGPARVSIAALDQSGHQLWRVFWDGDNPRPDNWSNHLEGLILNPRGGVLAIAMLEELAGSNSNCAATDINCWDFGLWAVGPSGVSLWTGRQDFNKSYWDIPWDAAFVRPGELIVVGTSIPHPTGDKSGTKEDADWVIAKFRVP
jgi:hypothetical protein